MHTPVLLKAVIDSLNIQSGGRYIDATYGEGGHSREIVALGGRALSIDFDEDNVEKNKQQENENLKIVWGNYADIEKIAKENNFIPCDGIIFDLGISMGQISHSGRGFSFKKLEEKLDMRISKTLITSAVDLLNQLSENEIYRLFSIGSQQLSSNLLAKAIVRARRSGSINTVRELNDLVKKSVGGDEANLRRVYQALRMAVNNEVENIKKGLAGALEIITPAGRIGVITFNETEDRLVKQTVQNLGARFLTKKPIYAVSPSQFEKTAKLRIILPKP